MRRYRVSRVLRLDGYDRLPGEVLTLDEQFAAPLVADGRLVKLPGSPCGVRYSNRMMTAGTDYDTRGR